MNTVSRKTKSNKRERKGVAGATRTRSTAAEAGHRGRTPGIYRLVGNREPKRPFKAGSVLERTYAMVRRRHNGVQTKDVVTKLDVTQGTAGWALWKLMEHKLVRHEPVAAH